MIGKHLLRRVAGAALGTLLAGASFGLQPAAPATALTWVKHSAYYSYTDYFWAAPLKRCVALKQFGNALYETSTFYGEDNLVTRQIKDLRLLEPTVVVQFYNKCGSGRTLKKLNAKISVIEGWVDSAPSWKWDPTISVSYPFSISTSAVWGVQAAQAKRTWGKANSNTFKWFRDDRTPVKFKGTAVEQHSLFSKAVYPKLTAKGTIEVRVSVGSTAWDSPDFSNPLTVS